jgi:preprotein translocase SecE subunit
LATKGKTTKKAEETKITRIKAKDVVPEKKTTAVTPKENKTTDESVGEEKTKNPFKALGRYFKGAWFEVRQVRWPTRRATWGLTLAVLAYTAFFIVVILLLDALFKYLFELMLG